MSKTIDELGDCRLEGIGSIWCEIYQRKPLPKFKRKWSIKSSRANDPRSWLSVEIVQLMNRTEVRGVGTVEMATKIYHAGLEEIGFSLILLLIF